MEDISVRDVYLPSFDVGATFAPREHGALPTASLYLHINKVEIHLSTDIVNQLLVVQSSFVKVHRFLIYVLQVYGIIDIRMYTLYLCMYVRKCMQ